MIVEVQLKAESLPEPDRTSLFTPEPDVVSEDYFYLDTSNFTQNQSLPCFTHVLPVFVDVYLCFTYV